MKLKRKIKIIKQDLNIKKENNKTKSFFITIVILLLCITTTYIIYNKILPIYKSININKIVGKKISITQCNTKDYIIISTDKSYSMKLTNNKCKQENYEGDIKIYKNTIIFNKHIEGIINTDYTISINNEKFERE